MPNRCRTCKYWLFNICGNWESRFYGSECSGMFSCEKYESFEVQPND